MNDIAILILAAGASKRMRGADKLIQLIGGVPLLRRVAQAALTLGLPVLVALPKNHDSRRAALDDLPVRILPVAAPQTGMSAAIRMGAAAIGPGQALMILPADLPDLDADDLAAMVAAHRSAPGNILRGADKGAPGHPVVIPHDLVPSLQRLRGDRGAKGLIEVHRVRTGLVPLPPGHATLDLDTPEDWQRWLTGHKKTGKLSPSEGRFLSDPIADAAQRPDQTVFAVITGVSGASYRKTGAYMALFADGTMSGNLSNGCIEGDLAIHAALALESGQVRHLRYGEGSPFFDIRLPCGGGLDVALYPRPDAAALSQALQWRSERRFFALRLGPDGRLSVDDQFQCGWQGEDFVIEMQPDISFAIFGDGPEASVFADLVQSCGYAFTLCSNLPSLINLSTTDPRTAIVSLFHDHDLEIPILAQALRSRAFYVGAQASRRVAERQRARLLDLGLTQEELSNLHAPIGLIPSARDPMTLAVSSLAEVLHQAAENERR